MSNKQQINEHKFSSPRRRGVAAHTYYTPRTLAAHILPSRRLDEDRQWMVSSVNESSSIVSRQ